MTRRIMASFLAVLIALLALVVVPLGATLAGRERRDFLHAAQGTARSLAAAAEERLGDPGDRGENAPFVPAVDKGDGVVVLDRQGRRVAAAGRPLGAAEVQAARAGRGRLRDDVLAATAVGSRSNPDGEVVVARNAEPLDHRIAVLWLSLAAAAVAALAVGAFLASALARWIGRPLRQLDAAAVRMGSGDIRVRTDPHRGPPEVREVALAFNEMADRIQSLLDSHRSMTSEVSHQLRTPLAALRLRLELLADDAPADLRPDLHDALRELGRLNRLTDGLLTVARAEQVASDPEAIDAAEVVRQRLELWRPVADERGVALSADIQPAWASATSGHLDQVLDNLIANALEALLAGGHVRLSIATQDGQVVIHVADDGPGMSPEERAGAFARFTGDRSKPGKSGLGLTIVDRLISADGGSVELAETIGGGLTVIVRLATARGSTRPRGLRQSTGRSALSCEPNTRG